MNLLEDSLLSEISQSDKDKCYLIPLLSGTREVELTDTERKWLPGAEGGGRGSYS